MADSQTGKKKTITPIITFLIRISPVVFPNLTKPLGGWVGQKISESFPKKIKFFGGGRGMGGWLP